MATQMNVEQGAAPGAAPAQREPVRGAPSAAAVSPSVNVLPGFEVHVAAGQVWFALPGHPQCRAMYPEHARAFALALERTADDQKDRRVFISDGRFFSIAATGPDSLLVREDTTQKPDTNGVSVPCPSARGLARVIRDAANRAERGTWATHAA